MRQILFSFILVMSVFGGYAQTTQMTQITLENKRFSPGWFNDLEKAKANPDKVQYLDLSLQKLKSFPKEIFTFTNLQELYLSYNYWTEIPAGFGALAKLEILDLSGNYYLNKLPADLGKLKALKELDVKDNKLNKGEVARAKAELPHAKVLDK